MNEDKQSNIKLSLKETKLKIQQNRSTIYSSNRLTQSTRSYRRGVNLDTSAMLGDESMIQLFPNPQLGFATPRARGSTR